MENSEKRGVSIEGNVGLLEERNNNLTRKIGFASKEIEKGNGIISEISEEFKSCKTRLKETKKENKESKEKINNMENMLNDKLRNEKEMEFNYEKVNGENKELKERDNRSKE